MSNFIAHIYNTIEGIFCFILQYSINMILPLSIKTSQNILNSL